MLAQKSIKLVGGILLLIVSSVAGVVLVIVYPHSVPAVVPVVGMLLYVGTYLVSPTAAKAVPAFFGIKLPAGAQQNSPGTGMVATHDTEVDTIRKQKGTIFGVEAPPPIGDEWYTRLRPILHEATYYSTPTYYLDPDLRVIDWNISFELIFSRIVGELRYRHVTWFINQMANRDQVFDHARDFTEQVQKGKLPLVDLEPLRYESENYGTVALLKVATQLHNSNGELHGWAVALFVRDIEWGKFQRDMLLSMSESKLWNVYAASYDRVLLKFPLYSQLIKDVISVVPRDARLVADLGAGTGNVSTQLRKMKVRLTAIENNPAMLDRLRQRLGDDGNITAIKASVEHLDFLDNEMFDAVVMVNVLYALEDPLRCLRGVHRILKPNGVLGFSTTHSETRLDPLLARIKSTLQEDGHWDELAHDYERLRAANKEIEATIARRHSREEYRDWVRNAGFEIIREESSTYVDAVMMIHARKKPA